MLATRKSTPLSPLVIMRLTALLPPPPTPITLILAPCPISSEKSTRSSPRLPSSFSAMVAPYSLPSEGSQDSVQKTLLPSVAQQAHPISVQGKAYDRGEGRILQALPHFLDADRHTDADRQMQDLLREAPKPAELCAATSQQHARSQLTLEARPRNFGPDQFQQLDCPRLDNLAQGRVRNDARRPVAHAGDFEHRARTMISLRGAPGSFHLFRLGDGCAQTHGDVVGKVLASHGHHGRVANRTLVVDDHVGRPAPDIDDRHTQLAVVRRE